MNVPPDAVLSYHTNTLTCGVAKFSDQLAKGLKVPFGSLREWTNYQHPLLSIKASELSGYWHTESYELTHFPPAFDLFLHEWSDMALEHRLVTGATRVWCANVKILDDVQKICPDAVAVHCPATIPLFDANRQEGLSIFMFGMSHKVRADLHLHFRTLLKIIGAPYHVGFSAGLHDGYAYDDEFMTFLDRLRAIYGRAFTFLGYLSDEAVAEQLTSADYVALFFEDGARANNTTLNSALAAGSTVITNLDYWSPPALKECVININTCTDLTTVDYWNLSTRARDVGQGELGWTRLLATMTTHG
jgi:hypothetical protein